MKFLKLQLLVIALATCVASSAFASYSFYVDVNTSALYGQTGYIDLQMNAANTANVAFAATSGYVSDAAFIGNAEYIGNTTGTLPANTLRIDTADQSVQMNDYFHQLTFGNSIHFQLNLDGAPGNTFAISFYGADQQTPLFSAVSGAAAMIDLTENGAVITSMSNETSVTPTPIPAAAWLFGSGLLGLVGIRRKKQN